MQVRIDDLNHDGRGRGTFDGRVALVSQAYPGELVDLRVDRTSAGTIQGRVAHLHEPRRDRVASHCPHRFSCTGCPLLELPWEDEAEFKHRLVTDLLRQALEQTPGRSVPVDPVEQPTRAFGYRHYAKQIFAAQGLGSYVAGTHQWVDNRHCPVLVPSLSALMADLADRVSAHRLALQSDTSPGLIAAVARQAHHSGDQRLVLVTSGAAESLVPLARAMLDAHPQLRGVVAMLQSASTNVLLQGTPVCLAGVPDLEEELLGYRHHIAPGAFFQINPLAARRVFEIALDAAGTGAVCVEGYAGVGALTLPLSERFQRVIAIEAHAPAIDALHRSARRAGRTGIEGIVADVEAHLGPVLEGHRPEVVVLDPPRRGVGPGVCDAVGRSTTERVVMVSCGPRALARDLPHLIAHGFALTRVVPVDQFPRTAHIEVVACLQR